MMMSGLHFVYAVCIMIIFYIRLWRYILIKDKEETMLKKVLSIVLAAMLVLSSVAALAETTFTPAATYDPGQRAFDGGAIKTEKAEGGSSGSVTTTAYAGIEGADYTDEKVYTYNDYMAAMGSGLAAEGVVVRGEKGAALLRPIKSGRGIRVFAESVSAELAAEFCDDLIARLNGQESDLLDSGAASV